MTADDGLVRCILSALLVTFVCQVALGFNQLYEYAVSSSRWERASRFVESAGVALALTVGLAFVAEFWGLDELLDFPGLSLSETIQTLVVAIVLCFVLAYLWRMVYHRAMLRLNLNQRVLVIGSSGPAHSLAKEILGHPEAGYEVAGMVPEPGEEREADDEHEADEPSSDPPPRGNGRPRLVSTDHEATDKTRGLVLESVALLEREVENRGVAMAGTRPEDDDGSLLALVSKLDVHMIVVALQDRRLRLPTGDLLRCRLAGIDVREREEMYEEITGKIAVEAMRPSYLIFNPASGVTRGRVCSSAAWTWPAP